MSPGLDRRLTRLYHAAGCTLFLALCAFVSYKAGDRHRPYRIGSAEAPAIKTGIPVHALCGRPQPPDMIATFPVMRRGPAPIAGRGCPPAAPGP